MTESSASSGRPRTHSTVAALLDAAGRRVAVDGFASASLRGIMRDAGADPGSIHYHFGGREQLMAALLERLLVPINDRRAELLDGLEAPSRGAEDRPIPMEGLIDALVRPDLEVARAMDRRGSQDARLVGLIYLEPATFVTAQVEQRFAPVARRFHPRLIEAAPTIAPETLAWRIRWCLFGTLGAVLADPGRPSLADPERFEYLLDHLVTTLTAAVGGGRRQSNAEAT